ncbi:hypothetical protein PIB30_015402 [Stylosanthes scabra]|uniref:SET domain-containing protein n=1 Tax=Stylosanthes scabra TaxID=79078 RepID=A0ABU6T6N3_9FABA|nr:hypothetical protein [Stylosanthes scabra]
MADSLLRVEHIAGKGRGLVASQPLKCGQVILTESPLILYSSSPLFPPSSSSSSSYCNHCFRTLLPTTTTASCPSCLTHHFCSNKCLSSSLNSSHSSIVCQALSSLRNSPLLQQQPLQRQVQARFLVALHNLAPSQIDTLLSLHGTPDDSVLQDANFLHDLISPLFNNKLISVDVIAEALAKDRINSFCLMEPYNSDGPQRSIKAYGIYPKATMFNHDCLPNACRFDYVDTTDNDEDDDGPNNNTDIIIRLIKDVDEGEEVCISYFRIGRDYATRKKILMEDYGFVCGCERCNIEATWREDEIDDDVAHVRFLRKYVCDMKNCGGTMAPLPPKHDSSSPSNVLECNFCGNFKISDDHVI